MKTPFTLEADFETALIALLQEKGWRNGVIEYPTEQDLLENWKRILFENNRQIDRLNDAPLTDTEMQQIMEQIAHLRTPMRLNGFINGRTVAIKRDNVDDKLHYGKEISLKIFDRYEIAASQSRYQIARQPEFRTPDPVHPNRRGDVVLLINGMPMIHIELKRSGVPVSQAYNQIEKYRHEGVFQGVFALVQICVAMTPEESVYYASPGPDGQFNKDYCFHWADFNNESIKDWQPFTSSLLNIPMAHQLIGFYTVADGSDGVLKVLRSYQYHAAYAISDKVAKTDWKKNNNLGGFIEHTTGSGKTMTSFKSAQLIAGSGKADKVVFLMDRIELGTQSLEEYQDFAEAHEEVQATEDTRTLISKLKSKSASNTLIVTSIQKMSRITEEEGVNQRDVELIQKKRMVIIIDECHRSTFGDMLLGIKNTFPSAILFGFTGTPIYDENSIKMSTTATVFGNQLHRYSIADGIRDGNILGFDPYKVLTYRDIDLRQEVALMKARANSIEEVYEHPKKKKVFMKYMDSSQVPMRSMVAEGGSGIEDEVKSAQYDREEHRQAVVDDIKENWVRLSHNELFYALLATSTIAEAIAYYRLIKNQMPDLKMTALFDPNIDNREGAAYKEDALVEIIKDYNELYKQKFTISSHGRFKKDLSARLSHRKPYERLALEPDKQLQLLIVVDQMLTGFDSKYLNTLYLDKVLEYQHVIQAFSRTNRLYGPEKPFGTIRYYRFPHTMERNIEKAIKLYSGEKAYGLFVDQLPHHLQMMNNIFAQMKLLFEREDIENFERLPDDKSVRGEFARQFVLFRQHMQAALIQGFTWELQQYVEQALEGDEGEEQHFQGYNIMVEFTEQIYLTLVQRYKELAQQVIDGGGSADEQLPFDIDTHITTIDTEQINSDYINSRFTKYIRSLDDDSLSPEEKTDVLNELHSSFARLSQEDQHYANLFLRDIQRGEAQLQSGLTLSDYIAAYKRTVKDGQVDQMVELLGVDRSLLSNMLILGLTEANLNDFGRMNDLRASVNMDLAKAYFESQGGAELSMRQVNMKVHELLKEFVLKGGFEL